MPKQKAYPFPPFRVFAAARKRRSRAPQIPKGAPLQRQPPSRPLPSHGAPTP